MILDGTQRRAALVALEAEGWTIPPLPVVYIYADDEAQARRILLSISSQYGEWVEEELSAWLDEIDDDVKKTLRLVDKEIRMSYRETGGDDDVPEVEEATTAPGDIYELNSHRLICGDSSLQENYEKLLQGNLIQFVFTDPPYGVSIGSKNKLLDTIQKAGRVTENIENDTISPEQLKELLTECFKQLKACSEDSCSYYVTAP